MAIHWGTCQVQGSNQACPEWPDPACVLRKVYVNTREWDIHRCASVRVRIYTEAHARVYSGYLYKYMYIYIYIYIYSRYSVIVNCILIE